MLGSSLWLANVVSCRVRNGERIWPGAVYEYFAPSETSKCGQGIQNPDEGGRVINGRPVKPTYKYPWIVAILFEGSAVVECGAALISSSFVLTAAHCVFHNSPGCQSGYYSAKDCYMAPSQILVGIPVNDKITPMPLKKIIPHPKFSYAKQIYDLALLQLKHPIQCTHKISPVCVADFDLDQPGQKLIVAGWGKNTNEGEDGSMVLREGVMRQIDAKRCKKPQKPHSAYMSEVCAVGTSETSCQVL
ncbi:serine protease 38 [Caerostris extrusa]|uniref:Serine protease 38 n=1 Tax=Caerostris extrusa TaxID=172846 RepID=A0AAV4V4K9_CAEEX|nr:serine protease 38 [Caerostris extrusa]